MSTFVFTTRGLLLDADETQAIDAKEAVVQLLSSRRDFVGRFSPETDPVAPRILKLNMFDKLDRLMLVSQPILVFRNKHETYGGEIAELVYGIGGRHSSKICLFHKRKVKISRMIMEFLDKYKGVLRSYEDDSDLLETVLRYTRYRLGDPSEAELNENQ